MALTNNRAGWQVSRKTNEACRPPRRQVFGFLEPGKASTGPPSNPILANPKAPVSALAIQAEIPNIGGGQNRPIHGRRRQSPRRLQDLT